VAPASVQQMRRRDGRAESRMIVGRFESRQDNAPHRQAQQLRVGFTGVGARGMVVAQGNPDA
jgi:hypothetical protein